MSPNKLPEQEEPITISSTNSGLSRFRSWKGLAQGAALAAALGIGAAACSSSPRSEVGSRPAAADAGDAGDAGDGGDAGGPDAGTPPPTEDGGADAGPPPPDFDRDGVPDDEDQCLSGDDNADIDNDGLCDTEDPCPTVPPEAGRLASEDNDADGVGARCDLDDTPVTGFDPTNSDTDLDRVLDRNDGCTGVPNGAPQVDGDGDGATTPCDCDDNNPAVHPAVPARIPAVSAADDVPGDGVDSDCNGLGGLVAENPDGTVVIAGEPTYTCRVGETRDDPDGVATGECEVGTQTCEAFAGGSAFGPVDGGVDAVPETCNTLDDDCDETADEDIVCDCEPGATRDCGTDEGKCEVGTQPCGADRRWTDECNDGVGPDESETCDDEDDDCDGEADENFGVGDACTGTGGCGVDGDGTIECATPSTTRCSTNPGGSEDRSTAEVCDGVDNDCDGSVDEGSYSVVGGQGTAAVGTACELPEVCGDGTYICAASQAVVCSSAADRVQSPGLLERPNFCNGIDDDCDDQTDEGCSCEDEETVACGVSEGTCDPGVQICRDGRVGDACEGTFVGPTAEECDGADNDCDGIIDDIGGRVAGAPCTGTGRCGEVPGSYECFGVPGVIEATLICSTMPNGSTDRAIAETCNGVDDDCDGSLDEGDWPGAGAVNMPCSLPEDCGDGVTRCDTTAATECSSIDLASTDGPPGACDGRDNDCDGAADEGCACESGTSRDCGTDEGACSEGTQACSSGTLGDCVGDVTPVTETCNGEDDDCDGDTDENFSVGDACRGRGECGVDTPGTPADEGAGVIECATTTTARCSVNPGGLSDQSSAELCNGLDDDCDGTADEGIGALGNVGTVCTLPGVCRDGTVECNGLLQTRCSSISAAVAEVCDGADNDCDTATDEGFNVGTSCTLPDPCGGGVLRCANPSSTECSSIDNAVPEVAGNLVDDDCDGSVDE